MGLRCQICFSFAQKRQVGIHIEYHYLQASLSVFYLNCNAKSETTLKINDY